MLCGSFGAAVCEPECVRTLIIILEHCSLWHVATGFASLIYCTHTFPTFHLRVRADSYSVLEIMQLAYTHFLRMGPAVDATATMWRFLMRCVNTTRHRKASNAHLVLSTGKPDLKGVTSLCEYILYFEHTIETIRIF